MKIHIMDTTLRDGEQTPDVSFSPDEKKIIAEHLLDIGVDSIETASALSSEKDKEAVRKIVEIADKKGKAEAVEVLGFADHKRSVDWIYESGCRTVNLLAKGSLNHVKVQLGKDREQHLEDIRKTVDYAKSKGLNVNIYLEAWSSGMKEDEKYVFDMLESLSKMELNRVMLPDTLGILSPNEVYEYVRKTVDRFPDLNLDFHAHNDHGLATANSLSAFKAGIKGLHTTVNTLGERTGNANLFEVSVGLKDFYNHNTNLKEEKFSYLSKLITLFSGVRISPNTPIVGDNAFVQTAGIHADGDSKGSLYITDLNPERFGMGKTHYALGKLSGKASVKQNLDELGIELDENALKKLTKKVIELGEAKQTITPHDLLFLVAEVLGNGRVKQFYFEDCNLGTSYTKEASANFIAHYKGERITGYDIGDGPIDALMKALRDSKVCIDNPEVKDLEIYDYEITIPQGGKSASLVRARIEWRGKKERFKTVGFSTDQNKAATKAIESMINVKLLKGSFSGE